MVHISFHTQMRILNSFSWLLTMFDKVAQQNTRWERWTMLHIDWLGRVRNAWWKCVKRYSEIKYPATLLKSWTFFSLLRCIPAYEFPLFCSYAPLNCFPGPVGRYCGAPSWAFPRVVLLQALRWVLRAITFKAIASVKPFVGNHKLE